MATSRTVFSSKSFRPLDFKVATGGGAGSKGVYLAKTLSAIGFKGGRLNYRKIPGSCPLRTESPLSDTKRGPVAVELKRLPTGLADKSHPYSLARDSGFGGTPFGAASLYNTIPTMNLLMILNGVVLLIAFILICFGQGEWKELRDGMLDALGKEKRPQ